LAEIAAYRLGEATAETARRVVADLLRRLDGILAFPESGAPRAYVRPGSRVVCKHQYSIYHQVTSAEIVIVRVLHGSRDVATILGDGGFGP
jgi:toxin ParE1/3/4